MSLLYYMHQGDDRNVPSRMCKQPLKQSTVSLCFNLHKALLVYSKQKTFHEVFALCLGN